MIIDKDRIQNAIDEFIKENEPPEDFYPVSEYKKLYPGRSSKQVLSVLDKMVTAGLAEKSEKQYGHNKVWHYKISIL